MIDAAAFADWLLYDRSGRHFGGRFDPLLVGGALTPAYVDLKTRRPATWFVGPQDGELGAVWMLPDELTIGTAIPDFVLGALVLLRDGGYSIRLDGVNVFALQYVARVIDIWAGGSRS